MARFLANEAALFKHLRLTANLVCQTIVQILEAVHVLQLGLRAEFRSPTATQRNVSIAAHAALFHGAVGNAQSKVNLTQLLHEQTRLFRRT